MRFGFVQNYSHMKNACGLRIVLSRTKKCLSNLRDDAQRYAPRAALFALYMKKHSGWLGLRMTCSKSRTVLPEAGSGHCRTINSPAFSTSAQPICDEETAPARESLTNAN